MQVTFDIPEKHEDLRCPVLDLAVRLEPREVSGNLKIRHTFYEKAVSAPTVFHSKAAYNWRSKLVTLSEEMRRRLRNMDTDHNTEEILAVTRKFCTKLANSGYNQQTRWEVLRSATTKYFRDLAEWKTGGKAMYRGREELALRRKFKALEMTTWF